MNNLPLELITIIINYISKITDKRQFTQTCKTYNNLTTPLIKSQELTIKIKHFKYPGNDNCVEKFTLELCNDSYFDKIPKYYLYPYNLYLVKALVIYNQLELLEIAISNGCYLYKYIDDVKYKYDDRNSNSCAHAVISGNIEMLIFVRLHGCEWDGKIFELAAQYNHLHILKFLVKYGCEISDSTTICTSEYAAENGNIDMINWLIENHYTTSFDMCEIAAGYGHLDMLKFLTKNNFYSDYHACVAAASNGQLECLQWLIKNGHQLDVSCVYSESALHNQRHIIVWMRKNGYVWDSKTCEWAIKGNNFDLLKWLVKEGCDLDINVYKVAIKKGNIEMIQWLKDNCCPTQ
jgi:hypothetical protein